MSQWDDGRAGLFTVAVEVLLRHAGRRISKRELFGVAFNVRFVLSLQFP